MSYERAYKKRHRKKHHRRPLEERPSPDENVSVDVYEAKEKDQANAEKATMDMIKEELSKEMGDDAGEESQPAEATPYNPGQE